jgi:hypothetical protein
MKMDLSSDNLRKLLAPNSESVKLAYLLAAVVVFGAPPLLQKASLPQPHH